MNQRQISRVSFQTQQPGSARPAGFILLLIGAMFVLVSMAVGYFALKKAAGFLEAKNWAHVPAVVEQSSLESHRGNKGSTYSINILYRYEINGRVYKSNRYGFFDVSSSSYGSKRAAVDENPPGKQLLVYVNPADPSQAVITTEVSTDAFIIGGMLALFLVVGLLLFFGGIRLLLRGDKTSSADSFGTVPTASQQKALQQLAAAGGMSEADLASHYPKSSSGEVILEPIVSAKAKAIGMLVVALFWNAIVAIFIIIQVSEWSHGKGEIVGTLFLTPFVLIGLAMFGGVVYFYLQTYNPLPRLFLSTAQVELGAGFDLRWELSGKVERIEEFSISLKGTEHATYRRGTRSCTDRDVFYEHQLIKVGKYGSLQSGRAAVQIPEKTMHSFESQNNKIVWSIEVNGNIPNWPDISESFPITVLPKAIAAEEQTLWNN
jgi:hypothetical protein